MIDKTKVVPAFDKTSLFASKENKEVGGVPCGVVAVAIIIYSAPAE